MTTPTPEDLIDNVSGLVTLPDVYLRINRLIDDPNSRSADIAQAISQDASLTVKLLRLANSALYNLNGRVDTVTKAVTLIGTSQVRNLALSLSVANSFAGLPNELVSMRNFWKHSLLCALCARHLGKLARAGDVDALFTAGLLHDIGELILFNRLPEQARQALQSVLDSQEEVGIPEAEEQIIGYDHSAVGAALAARWNLPSMLSECIAWHHHPDRAQEHPRAVSLVHIANSLAQLAEIDSLDPIDAPAIADSAWMRAGLDTSVIESVVRAAQAEFDEIEQLFLG